MSRSLDFRKAHFGREKLGPGLSIARHRHRQGYIAVIISGGYQEAGLGGRFNLQAGDVVVHRAFDAHLDRVNGVGAEVINLPLPAASLPPVFRIEDPDAIARLAEHDPAAAALSITPAGVTTRMADWPDDLALCLKEAPDQELREWASERGLAPETLSRGFLKAYGVTPMRYRAELKAVRAISMIEETDFALSEIGFAAGFADQSHLTRSIVSLTGRPPGAWRRKSIQFKT
jgi:AraC-like DNA-binding protein